MVVRYRVTLTADERDELRRFVLTRKRAFRRLKRAQFVLASEAGSLDHAIAKNGSVGTSTVYRTKRRFVDDGLETALSELPRPGAKPSTRRKGRGTLHCDGMFISTRRPCPLDAGIARERDGVSDEARLDLAQDDTAQTRGESDETVAEEEGVHFRRRRGLYRVEGKMSSTSMP